MLGHRVLWLARLLSFVITCHYQGCMTKLNIDIHFREELHLVRQLTDCDKAGGNKPAEGKKNIVHVLTAFDMK